MRAPAGLETVYQDLALCPNLSITHNMILGREETRRWLGVLPVRDDRKAAEQPAARRLAAPWVLRCATRMCWCARCPAASARSIAIARARCRNVKLICLDEPTAALGVKQTAQVVKLIRSIVLRAAPASS